MTASERLMLRGLRRVQDQQTRHGFTLSDDTGELGDFVGVCQQTDATEILQLGGTEEERTLTIIAEREQFTDASVTPAEGMSVTYQGQRYVIENIPSAHDEIAVTLQCVAPTSRK